MNLHFELSKISSSFFLFSFNDSFSVLLFPTKIDVKLSNRNKVLLPQFYAWQLKMKLIKFSRIQCVNYTYIPNAFIQQEKKIDLYTYLPCEKNGF